jgi:DNA-binding transcriptional MerR regulator
MSEYLKGQIAEIAQTNPETLRFYEKCNLIPSPKRSKSGYRLYPESVLYRLEFKNAKASGFTLNQIKEMFAITENRNVSMNDLIKAADEKISEIDSRIAVLVEMKALLNSFKSSEECPNQCPHMKAFLNSFKEE